MSGSPDRARILEEIAETAVLLSNEWQLQAFLERILTAARRLTRAEAGTIFLRHGEELSFAVVQNDVLFSRMGDAEMRRLLQSEPQPIDEQSLAGFVARTGRVVNIMDAYSVSAASGPGFNPHVDSRTGYVTVSVLATPITDKRDEVIGVMELINALTEEDAIVAFDPEFETPLEWLAEQAAAAIIRVRELEEPTFVDTLTALPNRRYFLRRLDEELRRHARFGHAVGVVWIVLDGLPSLRARAGHAAADDAIKANAQYLLHNSRSPIVLARFDESAFAAILPNATRHQAGSYATRIQRLFEALPEGEAQRVRLAVVSVPDDANSVEGVVQAGEAMVAPR